MVKAKLSDDLIIDEINNSKVNFNMSVDSIKVLSNEDVSSAVIEAMEIAFEKQTGVTQTATTPNTTSATNQTVAKSTSTVSAIAAPVATATNTLSSTATTPAAVTPVATVTPAATVVPSVNETPVTEKKYYVIAGSYKTVQEADVAVSKMKVMGTTTAEVVGKNDAGEWQVSYISFSTEDESMKYLAKIKQINSGAFILSSNTTKSVNPTYTETTSTATQSSTVSINENSKQPPIKQSESQEGSSKEKNNAGYSNKYLIEKSTLTVNAVSYVIPMEGLMTYFDNEFNSLVVTIQGWDKRVRDSLENEKRIKDKILQVEMELTAKKNSDSKAYNEEILSLKKELTNYREKYKKTSDNLIADGTYIANEIKKFGDNLDRSLDNKFDEVSHIVKTIDPDPAKGEVIKAIIITKQKFNGDIVNYVSPLTGMLSFYQNEILSLKDIIVLWDEKAVEVIQKDSILNKQLEPLKKEMEDYKTDPKKNKEKISELKKQCSKLEKDRKQLANQMVDDSKELSAYLKKVCEEVQNIVKVRLGDIIEDVNYSYQDKF
jgi:predicted  nucleic acid-binding Zn-ribbon protein